LIASLWALLTVLLAAFSPGHGWHKRHVMGALLGLAASVLLVVGKGPLDLDVRHLSGFGLALGCAFVWASYSVLCRLFAKEPSEGLALPCLVTAALALICNLIFEQWVWPIGQQTWLALVLLGLGPTGGAFLLWDIGMKHGDVSRLGVLAYASPVLSTALLIALGLASASAAVVAACVLMTAAAALSNFGGARNA
jgi:drug/metabolite transporter (DMT)-like permease